MKFKSIPLILSLLVMALIGGCAARGVKYLKQPASNFTFSARTEPCFGTCPVYELEINSSGKANFVGQEFTKLKGEHVKNLPMALVDSLRNLLIETRYLQLDTVYNDPYIADVASTHFRLISDEGKIDKKVWARFEEPEAVLKLEAFMNGVRQEYFTEE